MWNMYFPTSLIRAVGGESIGVADTASHWLTDKTESMTLSPAFYFSQRKGHGFLMNTWWAVLSVAHCDE